MKWALEKERKIVAKWVRKGGGGTVEKFHLVGTLIGHLGGQTTSVSA